MKTRILTSVVGIAALALVLFFFDTIIFNIVFAGACLIAVYEIYNAFHFGKNSLFIYIGFVPIVLLIMFSDYVGARMYIQPVGYLFVLFMALCVIINVNTVNFAKLSGMAAFSAIVVFCFFSLIHLKPLVPKAQYGYDAVYFILLILGYAWGGDTAAYFVGSAIGKHKLAPVVSPKKTVEGAIGGIFGSMLVGLLITVAYVQIYRQVTPLEFSGVGGWYYVVVTLLGIPASILGMVGDLFASAVKRQNGIKDYGSIFPGHGGILDRFDSVLFVAPLVVTAVRIVFYYFKR